MRLAVALAVVFCCGCPEAQPDKELTADGGTSSAVDVGGDAPTLQPDAGQTPDATSHDMDRQVDAGTDGAPIRTFSGPCPAAAANASPSWMGWGNVQFPRIQELEVGQVSEPFYGQVWGEGKTEAAGQAPGSQAQLVIGPLGAHPLQQPDCFRAVDAAFNVDQGNNDEWWVRLRPDRAGVYGVYFRYRMDAQQAWRYGDLNGSDDGVSVAEAAVLAVDDPAGVDEIRVVTLNLRCRTDDWAAREPLVIDALVAADPHIIGFQEDCADDSGPQSYALAAALADRLDRGYEVFRLGTHQADYPDGSYEEGIALLSSFPIDGHFPIDLPYANFPRKATMADVRLGDGVLRVINTHLDNGGGNDDVRDAAASMLVDNLSGPTVVLGDLNTDPGDPAYATLDAALVDAWTVGGSGDGATIPADAPTRRIDYIFARDLTVATASLFGQPVGGVSASDHLGVMVTLTRE